LLILDETSDGLDPKPSRKRPPFCGVPPGAELTIVIVAFFKRGWKQILHAAAVAKSGTNVFEAPGGGTHTARARGASLASSSFRGGGQCRMAKRRELLTAPKDGQCWLAHRLCNDQSVRLLGETGISVLEIRAARKLGDVLFEVDGKRRPK